MSIKRIGLAAIEVIPIVSCSILLPTGYYISLTILVASLSTALQDLPKTQFRQTKFSRILTSAICLLLIAAIVQSWSGIVDSIAGKLLDMPETVAEATAKSCVVVCLYVLLRSLFFVVVTTAEMD